MTLNEIILARCPRCAGPKLRFPSDLGATSRTDDETIVCARCGSDEAVRGPRGAYEDDRYMWPLSTPHAAINAQERAELAALKKEVAA